MQKTLETLRSKSCMWKIF